MTRTPWWRFPFKSDPRDARFYGTEAHDIPFSGNSAVGQYRVRLGRWRALWRWGAARPVPDLYRACFQVFLWEGRIAWNWKRERFGSADLHVVLGSLRVEVYRIEARATPDEVEHEMARINRADTKQWAEQHGLEPCRYCRAYGRSLEYCLTTCPDEWTARGGHA
jgi:hypothetical protein